jgi:hypothetical protein
VEWDLIQIIWQKNPKKKFTGIDLTSNNIKHALEKSKELNNTIFNQNDFDSTILTEKNMT